LLCLWCGGIALGDVVHIRRSIFALDPNGPEIASLRHGIQVMQSRAASDPTSWIYQANMHGTTDQPPQTAWNTCTHRNFFFFSWHRMYLYYLERILRAASGDPNLTLPYWNYSYSVTDPPPQPNPEPGDTTVMWWHKLPLAFRQPANSSNPLFVSQRNPGINAGTTLLEDADVDFSQAFAFTNFEAPTDSGFTSFGGAPPAPGLIHFDGSGVNEGALESTPHDPVHGRIGGWMATINLSARDPIFYLHHANIDRLWKRWLAQNQGRQDPTSDSVWMTTQFTFFDENGQQVQKSGRDILDTVGQLDYCYDDDSGCKIPITVYLGGYWIILGGE
jgi:tyrosinase